MKFKILTPKTVPNFSSKFGEFRRPRLIHISNIDIIGWQVIKDMFIVIKASTEGYFPGERKIMKNFENEYDIKYYSKSVFLDSNIHNLRVNKYNKKEIVWFPQILDIEMNEFLPFDNYNNYKDLYKFGIVVTDNRSYRAEERQSGDYQLLNKEVFQTKFHGTIEVYN